MPARSQQVTEAMTPLLLDVQHAPIPFLGSDGRIHPVYELWITNFSAIMPVAPPRTVRNALPLDQLEISFDSR